MKTVDNIWTSFKKQPDVWFFCAFLVFLTLSVRKILYFLPIGGQFNEYGAIFIYISDILLAGCLISCIFILKHNKEYLSIYRNLKQPIFYLPFLLVFWAFLSIFWSTDKRLAIFGSFKLLEFYLLYLYVAFKMFHDSKNVARGTFLKWFMRIIMF